MAFLKTSNVTIRGIHTCVPKNVEQNDKSVFTDEAFLNKFIKTTGIKQRHICTKEQSVTDLLQSSAESILNDLNWNSSDIDLIICNTQTPDFLYPSTSAIMHKKLNLKPTTYCIDLSMGCSGFVYSLSVITALMQSGFFKKALLMVGDTQSKACARSDLNTYPLFGDAGSSCALEYSNQDSSDMYFGLYTNGAGEDAIKNETGFKNLEFQKNFMKMNGADVFSFAISKAPESIKLLSEEFSIKLNEIDYFFMHQANFFLNETIRKKLNIHESKHPYSLFDYGNTSCVSIPLTISTYFEQKKIKKTNIIACGFGVGLSWAVTNFKIGEGFSAKTFEL